uniref:Uncharacterized protein n=1 Tax=Trichobilharzia regenti TaxID=157069 RepID=A0AA85K485_TRIRE|nr:unnamed protein product [Trichobilharzia regenti]
MERYWCGLERGYSQFLADSSMSTNPFPVDFGIFKFHGTNSKSCLNVETTRSFNKLPYYFKLVQYEILREVMIDLAYEYELNLLTSRERQAYEILAAVWSECHLIEGMRKINLIDSEIYRDMIVNDIIPLLNRNIEKKLDDRLALFADNNNQDVLKFDSLTSIDEIQEKKRQLSLQLRKSQARFTEAVCRIYTLSSRLFRDYRFELCPILSRQARLVIDEQTHALLLKAKNLQYTLQDTSSKSSAKVDTLQRTHQELEDSRRKLKQEVEELDRLDKAYTRKDEAYHELVKQYIDCQQQLSLRSKLYSIWSQSIV